MPIKTRAHQTSCGDMVWINGTNSSRHRRAVCAGSPDFHRFIEGLDIPRSQRRLLALTLINYTGNASSLANPASTLDKA
jgi:hypothetical protein